MLRVARGLQLLPFVLMVPAYHAAGTVGPSAILFVLDNRAASAVEKHVRITPLVSPKGGGIAAQLEF